MSIESLFKSLLEITPTEKQDPNTLCCPGFEPTKDSWGGCFNHEIGTFSYCGDDDVLIKGMTFVGTDLNSFTKSYKKEEIRVDHRVRGLSTITLFLCEHHGQWIEKRSFHKGETLVTRMFVELVDDSGKKLNDADTNTLLMLFNLFNIEKPNYTFIPKKIN